MNASFLFLGVSMTQGTYGKDVCLAGVQERPRLSKPGYLEGRPRRKIKTKMNCGYEKGNDVLNKCRLAACFLAVQKGMNEISSLCVALFSEFATRNLIIGVCRSHCHWSAVRLRSR